MCWPFGGEFGYDGQGTRKEEYTQAWGKSQIADRLLEGLDTLDTLDGLA
jgi:hypothetical protein